MTNLLIAGVLVAAWSAFMILPSFWVIHVLVEQFNPSPFKRVLAIFVALLTLIIGVAGYCWLAISLPTLLTV